MQLYHDNPESKGVENALKRAAQLRDIEWYPVRMMSSGKSLCFGPGLPHKEGPDGDHMSVANYIPPYSPVKGMQYSSVRIHEKFVGYNVSIETFMTALANPNSVLYTRPQEKCGIRMFSYYGTVCSCYVSYVCGFPYRIANSNVPFLEGIEELPTEDLGKLKLCDIVDKPGTHIAVITDLERDAEGTLQYITVSESVVPFALSKRYTPFQFRKVWLEEGYRLFRYHHLDEAEYTPSPFVHVEGDPVPNEPHVNTALMPDFGNKANYILGEEPVELTRLEDGWEAAEITAPDGTVTVVPFAENGIAVYDPQQPGYYSAVAVAAGKKSEAVEWCSIHVQLTTDKSVYKVGETVEVAFKNTLGDEVACFICNNAETNYIKRQGIYSKEESAAGAAEMAGLGAGLYDLTVVSRGKFGMYACSKVRFTIEE